MIHILKLNILNYFLKIIKKFTLRLLALQSEYKASNEISDLEQGKIDLDLRSMKERLKNVMLHDDDIIQKRWDICQSCEFLFKPTNSCKKCGCFMKGKVRVATASCPVGKWDKEYDFIKNRPLPNGI